jgi:hypothetical protein
LVNAVIKIITNYKWQAHHFALHREDLFAHLWIFCIIVLQFLHSLHFDRKSPRINWGWISAALIL